MPTIYSTSPYFDDFDETKQFYRILFRPGRAVQARELTQLQTMIQAQIERFGKNIFKDGSIVIPAEQVLDQRYSFVKLQTTFNSIDADDVIEDLVDSIIIGRTTGIRALVVNFTVGNTTDPPTIFVKYLNSGTNNTTRVFADNEIIDNETTTITVRAATSSATGNGSAYSIGSGAIFVKGSFVYIDDQTKVISKYSTVSNIIVGFDVTESVIESDDDESLLDPAVGTFNYFAPGADRYKIGLTLNTREFTVSPLDDPNFVELARIEDGAIISQNRDPIYNILGDTLARRTYDESGDYIVRPFQLRLQEHLRTTNANVFLTVVDGRYTAAQGGNSAYFVNILTPGKAYVRGYEIDTVRTKYINARKARDFVSVNDSPVATEIGSFVYVSNAYSIPNLSELGVVDLYNRYTTTAGSPSGTKVGRGRARHLEFYSGTLGSSSAVYRFYLFDVVMEPGFTFVDDVKQFFTDNATIPDFTADLVATETQLTGTVTISTESNVVTGVGTRFNSELLVGDFINIDDTSYRVDLISNNNSLAFVANATSNVAGVNFNIEKATLNEPEKNVYIFPFPYEVIKSVDSTGLETNYSSRRVYTRTLSGGNVSITAGTDETFAPVSTTNYLIAIGSGADAGNIFSPTGNITRSGSPTGKTITVSLPGLTTETITLVTTVQKTQSAAVRKIKTLQNNATTTYTTEADCTATSLSLGKADIYRLRSVRMSANAFGTAYTASNSVDITNRYTLDNGQRTTYYDVGRIKLKPNAAKPTGPLLITFDYFTHGTGDFFSVGSYQAIDYSDIPVFSAGDVDFNLRDCLDFRPRISDTGNVFSGTGSITEMISQEDDLVTDYEYYLPRIDKVVLDRNGLVNYINGVSSLNPVEPLTPVNTMPLFVLRQKPYVFDLYKDIEIFTVDNKRYTMKDISRIENRVKTLEYYTSLNLLERETEQFQIKDALGFDRFKNGFIVDSFTGHGIGDVYNTDYGIAVDYNKQEARPLCETQFTKLVELNTSDAGRTANSYVRFGEFFTLPYTEEMFISNDKSSKSVFLNPFNITIFVGTATIDPPADTWFDTNKLPDILINQEGNYDSVVADAQAKGTWGTIWGSWRDVYYGNNGELLVQQREGTKYSVKEKIDTTVTDSVVINTSVLPKMRDVKIKISGQGLKPNTRMYAFFNKQQVTQYCVQDVSDAVVNFVGVTGPNLGILSKVTSNIVTDVTGNIKVIFNYVADILNFNTGTYSLKLTDSPTNSADDTTTFVESTFTSTGTLKNTQDTVISTRNGVLNSKTVYDEQTVVVETPTAPPPPPPPPVVDDPYDPDIVDPPTTPVVVEPVVDPVPPPPEPPPQGLDYINALYRYGFGREPDPEGYAYWNQYFRDQGITDSTIANMSASNDFPNYQAWDFNTGNLNIPSSYNTAAEKVFNATVDFFMGGVGKEAAFDGQTNSVLVGFYSESGLPPVSASQASAMQLVMGIINPIPGEDADYIDDRNAVLNNGINDNATWTSPTEYNTGTGG